MGLTYENAAPTAMIGASNHFEVAIATATMLYGLSSGAALATVVGVLIEVPLMLILVKFCLKTQGWFHHGTTFQHCRCATGQKQPVPFKESFHESGSTQRVFWQDVSR